MPQLGRGPMRTLLARLSCKLWGHPLACAIVAYPSLHVQQHAHVCTRCHTVTRDDWEPVTTSTARTLADMGLSTVDQQQGFAN